MDVTCQPSVLLDEQENSVNEENINASLPMDFTCFNSVLSNLRKTSNYMNKENIHKEIEETNSSRAMDFTCQPFISNKSNLVENSCHPKQWKVNDQTDFITNEESGANSIINSFEMHDSKFLNTNSLHMLSSHCDPLSRDRNEQNLNFISCISTKNECRIEQNDFQVHEQNRLFENKTNMSCRSKLQESKIEIDKEGLQDKIIYHEQISNDPHKSKEEHKKVDIQPTLPSKVSNDFSDSLKLIARNSSNECSKRPFPTTPGAVYSIRTIKKLKVSNSDSNNEDSESSLKTKAASPVDTSPTELIKNVVAANDEHREDCSYSAANKSNLKVKENIIKDQVPPNIHTSDMSLKWPESKYIDIIDDSKQNLKVEEMCLDGSITPVIHEQSKVDLKNVTPELKQNLQEDKILLSVPNLSGSQESPIVNVKNITTEFEPGLMDKTMVLDMPKSSALLESSDANNKVADLSNDIITDVKVIQNFQAAGTNDAPEIRIFLQSSVLNSEDAVSDQHIEQNVEAKVVFSPDASQRKSIKEKTLLSSSLKIPHSEETKTTKIRLELKSPDKKEFSLMLNISSSPKQEKSFISKESSIIPKSAPSNTASELKLESEKMISPEKSSTIISAKENIPVNTLQPSPTAESESSSPEPINTKDSMPRTPVPGDSTFTLNGFKECLEQASSGDKCKWKLKTLKEDKAVFILSWGSTGIGMNWLEYKCTLFLHIQQAGSNKSSIEFRRGPEDGPYPDDIIELGYKAFHHLVKDKTLMHPVCSKETLLKLSEYSSIALRVETLMKDVLKLFFSKSDYTYKISEEMDPLEIDIRVKITKQKSVYSVCRLIFPIDLNSYPDVKIVPKIQHQFYNNLTDDILKATASVKPGRRYIWRMTLAAHSV